MSTFSTKLKGDILQGMDIYEIRKANLLSLIGTQRKSVCADRWGMSPAHLSQILSTKTPKNLGDDVARRIEALQGLPHGWLDTIQVAPKSNGNAEQPGSPVVKSAADMVRSMLEKHGRGLPEDARRRVLAAADGAEHGGAAEVDYYRPGVVGDEVWIAHYDVRAAMGGGQIPHDYPEMLQDVRVSPQHLREMGVDFVEHYNLKVVTGWGQSMAPTIKHRDPLLVDISIREFVGDGIYMFSWDSHLYIKRLQWMGEDRLKMISDNPHHPPETIRAEDTYIQARVLLVWNSHLL